MNDRYLVLTPEKVVLAYQLAGAGPRIAAHIVDLGVVAVLLVAIMLLLGFAGIVLGAGLTTLISTLIVTFGIYAYFILFEGISGGQTIGKKMMGLRVVMIDGTPLTWGACFMRNILRLADILPGTYLLGLITMFLNEKSQRLGDIISGTVVVRQFSAPEGFTPAPHRAGVHPLEQHVPDLSRMNLEEYFAIKRLCDRFPYLPPEEQYRSIADIWEPFRKSKHFPSVPGVHPIYLMEAVVMKFGRMHNLV
ncbi:RDD family protein [Kamptonema cortianum]|nr:RDD family protein [Geitlerinema splendidum]MDK3160942.1 RDD family protein [Kamptonema cortianum]